MHNIAGFLYIDAFVSGQVCQLRRCRKLSAGGLDDFSNFQDHILPN